MRAASESEQTQGGRIRAGDSGQGSLGVGGYYFKSLRGLLGGHGIGLFPKPGLGKGGNGGTYRTHRLAQMELPCVGRGLIVS